MSDEDLDLVAAGETPPPDKPDTKTQEELNRLEIGRKADELQTKKTLRKPILVVVLALVVLMVIFLFLQGFHAWGFSLASNVLTALVVGVFASIVGIMLKYMFK